MLLSPSSKIRSYTGRELGGLPSFLWGGVGGRELWLQTRPYSHRAKHLGRHDHLGLVPPLIQLEKRSGEFRREQKVLSRISGLSGRDHTLEAVVRKLGVNRQQSLARMGPSAQKHTIDDSPSSDSDSSERAAVSPAASEPADEADARIKLAGIATMRRRIAIGGERAQSIVHS
jgi:hypothetical protein